jgi:hypothetical protein
MRRIACMLIEPIMGNCLGIAAEPEYLRAARALCDKHGVVLLIDEVKTGFRVARGGVQELYGVQGRPVHLRQGARQRLSDLGARRARGHHAQDRQGRRARRHLHRALGVARGGGEDAARFSMRPTRSSASPTTARAARGMRAILSARGIAHSFVGHPSMSGLYFAHEPPRNYRAGRAATTRSTMRWRRCCTMRACCASRIRASRGSYRRRTMPRASRHAAGVRDRRRRDAASGRRARTKCRLERPGGGARQAPRCDHRRRRPQRPGRGLLPARAGSRCWCSSAALHRRRGGEPPLYKDFTYSNCSYVCSLLRPRSCARWSCRSHGLQVIPYEGGCTMMQDGGHLALYDNHDALRREIARHSKRDAEAYDRYSRDVMRQCKFIKPLLMREPPDPTSFKPRDIMELLYLGKRFHGLGEERMYDTLRFWTMSAPIFSTSISRARSSRRTSPAAPSSARRWGRARRAPPTCCCITTWATSTTRSAPGDLRAAAWARSAMRSAPRSGERRHDPQRRAGRANPGARRPRDGVVLEDGEEIARRW